MTKLLAVALLLTAPALVFAGPAHFYDEPDTTYATNVVIDIIEHNGGIWFATGAGINFSFDGGDTWLLYDQSNGLPQSDVSALYSDGGRLWAASNYEGEIGGDPVTYSDTLVYTDDNGDTWMKVNFGSVPFAAGPFRTIYDITGVNGFNGSDYVFAAAFAGGFLGSADRGATWRRIFPNRGDSVNFADAYAQPQRAQLSLRNRYFSCKVDTSHGDSLFVWAGTAGGVLQYIFNHPTSKIYTYDVQDVALCQSCRGKSSDSNFVFIAGKNGVTRGTANGFSFLTRFADGGLSGNMATAIYEFGGVVFAGTADSSAPNAGTGVAVSVDYGLSYTPALTEPAAVGTDRRVREFVSVDGRVYAAIQEAGLWSTVDTGFTWEKILIDSANADAANGWNHAWSLASHADTLFVGTDSGLAVLFLATGGSIDSTRMVPFANDADKSSRVSQVELQLFGLDTLTGIADSFYIWTIHSSPAAGERSIGRSIDRGVTWEFFQKDVLTLDLAIAGDTAYAVDTGGVKYANLKLETVSFVKADIRQSFDTLTDVNAVTSFRQYVVFGADSGLAISNDHGRSYRVYHPNFSPIVPDLVGLYTDSTTQNLDSNSIYQPGLLGNFIPALEVRYVDAQSAQVIASCRPTDRGRDGVSIGTSVPVIVIDTSGGTQDTVGYGYRWEPVYAGQFAWNISAHGSDTVYIATDIGLMIGTGLGTDDQVLDTIEFRNASGTQLLFPGTPVYAARQVDEYLWAGTDDGTVRIGLYDLSEQKLFIRTDPAEELYAFPVPFSPNRGDAVRFHFSVPVSGNVTLEVFDFAMRLVATPIESRFFDAGIYPPGPAGDERPFWDGRNEKGDVAAVGMYYIKVTYGNGDVKWGKLAIVP